MHVACVGNAIIDALVEFSPDDLQTYVRDGSLALPLGDKILIAQSELQLGGNASNVSVGFSRLGHQSTLFAEIGDDLLGSVIQQTLAQEQVDTKGIVKKGKTALDVSLNAKQDRVILVDHQQRGNIFEIPYERYDAVYLTSLGSHWGDIYTQVCTARAAQKLVVACNPGSVQLKEKERFLPFLKQLDVLILNVEEAALLAGRRVVIKKGESAEKTRELIRSLFEGLFAQGGSLIVITDGTAGSYVAKSGEQQIHFCATFGTPVVEKTGAGDAFAVGFLASFLEGGSREESLLSGTANGSSVVEYIGAQKGLLTVSQMQERKKLAQKPVEVING